MDKKIIDADNNNLLTFQALHVYKISLLFLYTLEQICIVCIVF